MVIQVKTYNDVWKEDKEGRLTKVVKRNVITECEIDTENITFLSEVVNSRGNIDKKKCKIILRGSNEPLIINHSYQQISKLRRPIEVKGFKR